jgi:hypothetical protein
MIYSGGNVKMIHTGVTNSIRMNNVVKAGLVLADVAVLCVERKSVKRNIGSSNILQRDVNSLRVSTISSRLLWCRVLPSDSARLCPFCPFSPVHPVDDSGEYRRAYMPNMRPNTTTNGPAERMTASPYIVIAQNAATSKKLSQGSPVVHVSRPTILLRGRRKGCEYANTRVICGGVATSSGDFWCTRIVERSFVCVLDCPRGVGVKAAKVGGLGSPFGCGVAPPLSTGWEGLDI